MASNATGTDHPPAARSRREPPGIGAAEAWLFGLLIAPFVTITILGSMLPATDFDVLEYHLQGPKEYFQAGRIHYLPHNIYTNMPFDVEMLHLLGMEVMADWWWGRWRASSWSRCSGRPPPCSSTRRPGASPPERAGSRPSSTSRRPGSTAWA